MKCTEVLEVGKASWVARRHGIDGKLLSRWMSQSKQTNGKKTAPEAKKIMAYTPSSKEF